MNTWWLMVVKLIVNIPKQQQSYAILVVMGRLSIHRQKNTLTSQLRVPTPPPAAAKTRARPGIYGPTGVFNTSKHDLGLFNTFAHQ